MVADTVATSSGPAAEDSRSMTTMSGALNPMPKPSVRRSYAWRWVVCAGASPGRREGRLHRQGGRGEAASMATEPRR